MKDAVIACKAIIQSDQDYFSTGAKRIDIPGGFIHHMPGFERIAAGACAHLLDADAIGNDHEAWVAELVRHFLSLGRGYARVYVIDRCDPLEAALAARGFLECHETAMAANIDTDFKTTAVEGFGLRRIVTEHDWAEKQAIYRGAHSTPDGKSGHPNAWLALERRKCEAGYLLPYLITRQGRAIATFSIAPRRGLLRIKNVMVAARFRRMGAASAIIDYSRALADENNLSAIGLLALTGGIGEQMYLSRGMHIVGHISEYVLNAKSMGKAARQLPSRP